MTLDLGNPLLSSLEMAKASLRDCFHWRALGGATPWTEQQAADRIYYDELPAPETADFTLEEMAALRPFCLLWLDVNGGLKMTSETSGSCCWTPSGSVIYQIELPVPQSLANSPQDLAIDLHQKLGRIIRTCDPEKPGLCDLAHRAGYLPIRDVVYRGYVRTNRKAAAEIGDAVRCELECMWSSL